MAGSGEQGGWVSHRELVVAQVELIAQSTGTATVEEWAKLDRIVETAGGEPIEWRIAYRKV